VGAGEAAWWHGGVIYQTYVRSFADSNGDGVGDLQGIVDRLDHIEWLGVDAIWLSPITPSPNADWGYDVSDFTDVDPELGDLGVLDRLVADAARRGIRVIVDLVPNHTSDRHPWFVEARSDRGSPHRDWYVWADGVAGGPPNNWTSVFGGPAWTWDAASEQYYLHNFLPEQPDLNWWNTDVRREFERILRFWFDRGIAGFRIDVAHGLVKDRDLRDNPPVTDDDHPRVRQLGLRPVYNMNRPEVHDVYRRWREVADTYDPPRVLIGETWLFDLPELMAFYGADAAELDLAMNFPFVFSTLGEEMREVVRATETALSGTAWPVWIGSNHDAGRFPTRWAGGDERKIRSALVLLLTLRGTPILYYGDEIGMPEVAVPRDALLDPVGIRGWPSDPGRDGSRTPMRWSGGAGVGFASPEVEPWLPAGDPSDPTVADQRSDPGSVLHLCRDLIALRRTTPELQTGASEDLPAPPGVWAWRRGSDLVVVLNLAEDPVEMPLEGATVLIATDRRRDGEAVSGSLRLDGWSAAVARLG
jgi:alpha-glucosidase